MLDYHRNRKLDTTDMNKVSRNHAKIIGSTLQSMGFDFPFYRSWKKKIYIKFIVQIQIKDLKQRFEKRKKNVSASKIESSINEQATKKDFP